MEVVLPYTPHSRQVIGHLSDAREIFYGGAAGGGKLLELSTEIPTPHGFVTMGTIRVGDEVFAPDGSVCRVTAVSELELDRTFRLTFSDGTQIVAGDQHQWVTQDLRERTRELKCSEGHRARRRASRPSRSLGKRPDLAERNKREAKSQNLPLSSIRTTGEIFSTLTVRGRVNHSIDVCKPLQLPERALLVDPYVLGAWLGDGTSASGAITGLDDEIFEEVANAGFTVTRLAVAKTRGVLKLAPRLREIGVLNNKHIPRDYLRASHDQRLALLQGLMDTDGTCDTRGQCEFSVVNKRLAEDVQELIGTLGIKVAMQESDAKLYGRVISKRYRLKFMTDLPVFRLSRKLIRQKRGGFRGTHDKRFIVACEEIPAQKMKCIEVDHPSHCYLVTRSFISTHNSAFARWDLFDFCLNCPRLFAVLFRESAPQLKANHIEPFHRELANVPNSIIQWNETNKEFRFHNGSLLVFRHLGDNQALRDIQGWEIHMAAIDEASLLDPQAIAFVKSRMRMGNYRKFLEEEAKKNPRINEYLRRLPRLILTSNPGGPSHLYLKDNYISPAPPEEKFEVDMDGDIVTRVFIPAKMKDNPLLETGYKAQFADLPEYQRKQLVEGDWNVVPGAYFDCWSEDKHVIEPFAIPPHWTRFRSMDWGYATPFSVNWFAVADETPVLSKTGMEYTFKPGSLVMYREWYGAQMGKNGPVNKGLRLTAPEVARRIMAMESGERVSYGVADPSMWRSDGGISVAEQMEQEGLYWARAANERAAGATLLYSRLNSGLMYVFRTCPNFIRTLPTMVSDDKKPEEYKKEGQDHCVDSVRYAVMSRPELSDAPEIPPPSLRLPTLDELKPSYGHKWI